MLTNSVTQPATSRCLCFKRFLFLKFCYIFSNIFKMPYPFPWNACELLEMPSTATILGREQSFPTQHGNFRPARNLQQQVGAGAQELSSRGHAAWDVPRKDLDTLKTLCQSWALKRDFSWTTSLVHDNPRLGSLPRDWQRWLNIAPMMTESDDLTQVDSTQGKSVFQTRKECRSTASVDS